MKILVEDFKQNDDDIVIDSVTGDFLFVPSDNQHILDIFVSAPGWWKNSLSTGAKVNQLLKGKLNIPNLESVIKIQLEADGYQAGRPSIKNVSGNFTIVPNAVRL
jgi:hypothetical protein